MPIILPSTYLKFKSLGEKRYAINHIPVHPKGPFLNLIGFDKDKSDFEKVSRDVLGITGGYPEGIEGTYLAMLFPFIMRSNSSLSDRLLKKALSRSLIDRGDNIIVSFDVPKYTQLQLYNFVKGYRKCFRELEFDKELEKLVRDYDAHESILNERAQATA